MLLHLPIYTTPYSTYHDSSMASSKSQNGTIVTSPQTPIIRHTSGHFSLKKGLPVKFVAQTGTLAFLIDTAPIVHNLERFIHENSTLLEYSM